LIIAKRFDTQQKVRNTAYYQKNRDKALAAAQRAKAKTTGNIQTKMTKIEEAVINCRSEIAVVQAAIQNLGVLERVLGDDYSGQTAEETRQPLQALRTLLHKKLTHKWDKLSMLTPISVEAAALVRERAEAWFSGANHAVMAWLGEYRSYACADRDKFQAELAKAFEVPFIPQELGKIKKRKAKVCPINAGTYST